MTGLLRSVPGGVVLTLCGVLTGAWADSVKISSVSSVSIEGLPEIRFGDSVAAVQKVLHTNLEPEVMPIAGPRMPVMSPNRKTQLRLKTRGIWIFFDQDKVYEVRLDAPFPGTIGGVRLGDSGEKVEKTFG